MAETPLQQKLYANKAAIIARADATANRERLQQTTQSQSQQAQLLAQQQEQEQLQKQIAQYNSQVQQLEAEQKAEADKAAAIKAAEQKRIEQQKTINDSYDAQIVSLGPRPSKYYRKPVYKTNPRNGIRTIIGYDRESNSKEIKRYSSKVAAINRERETANQKFSLTNSDLPQWAKSKASRAFARTPNHHGTMLSVAQNYYNNYLIKSKHDRESSITAARSNAVKAREQHEKTIREFEKNRESAPTQIVPIIDKPLISATKIKPKVHYSSYFKSIEKTPVSIFGTTPLQSQKAQETYDTTQAQQSELFGKVTGAASWNEAISHRQDAMKNNAYVGTANVLFEKGNAVGSSGVLIEKRLHKPKDIFDDLAEPISHTQDDIIQTDTITPETIQPEIKLESNNTNKIPTYEFQEQIIPIHNTPKHHKSWSYMSTLLDMEPQTPSNTDKLINQYIQNNQKQIDNTKGTGEATTIKIPVLDAVRDYGVEFGLGLASLYATARGKLYNEPEIITQQKIQKIYDSTPHEESIETVLFDSVMESSKNTPAVINPVSGTSNIIPKKESYSIPTSKDYVNEKLKTWQGTEYLAGTIGVSILGAFLPFGKGKQIAGHVAKQVIHTTPQSPNNLAYLLKSSHQEPKIITKKVTVADGGTFDVIDFDAMRKAKTTTYTPTINDKIKKKSKKPSRRNDPISKASRKIKFENTMYNHELEKATKTTETPMLDKLLGKPSRYVDTSAKIHNKKLQDKSIQIKDNITDSISDNIIDPVSKRTTKPIRKFVRKAQVSKQIKGYDLEKISKQYPSKIYDVTDAMKKPEINQNVFNDIVKKIDKKKKPLTKQQKAEPGQDWNVSNNEADVPAVSKQSTKSSTQIVETKPPKVKSKTKSPNKSKKKQQDDFTIVEQFLHQNRPKIKSTQTPMLDDLLGQKVGQRDTIKPTHPKTLQYIRIDAK